MLKKTGILILLFMISILAACNKEEADQTANDAKNSGSDKVENKVIDIYNTDEEKIGTAELEEIPKGVVVELKAEGLPPGMHGFHFHETGKCEAPTFESAGGHFNPTNAKHGTENGEGPHAGDLPNLEVEDDGTVSVTVNAEDVSLSDNDDASLIGTALVIHENPDDGKTQPSGDAGDRIACGVIE